MRDAGEDPKFSFSPVSFRCILKKVQMSSKQLDVRI